jgi:hypothetical protein
MPVLDSHGLFDGDRINSCSVMAQLYYPRMMCASNGYGRIQVSYRKIVAEAFPRWNEKSIPPEPELMSYFKEYAEQRLIFLYQSNGQIWGQWDAKGKTFGKYQTTEDKRSPAPPADEFAAWQEQNRQHSLKPSVPMVHFDLSNPEEILPQGLEKLRNGTEQNGHGIGIRYEVLGIGKGEKHSSNSCELDRSPVSDPEAAAKSKTENEIIEKVFEHYIFSTRRNAKTYSLTPPRRKKALARLRECLPKTGGDYEKAGELLIIAIDNLAASDWHMGRDPTSQGKKYCDWIDNLFKSQEQLEKWWNR